MAVLGNVANCEGVDGGLRSGRYDWARGDIAETMGLLTTIVTGFLGMLWAGYEVVMKGINPAAN